MPEPLPKHDRIGGLHAVHDTAQVDVQDAIPVFEFVVTSLPHDANSRDVENVVQASRALKLVLDQPVRREEVSDIQGLGVRSAAALSNSDGDFRRLVDLQVGQDDPCPAPCQRFSQRAADARSAAGDDGNRPREGPERTDAALWPRKPGLPHSCRGQRAAHIGPASARCSWSTYGKYAVKAYR